MESFGSFVEEAEIRRIPRKLQTEGFWVMIFCNTSYKSAVGRLFAKN